MKSETPIPLADQIAAVQQAHDYFTAIGDEAAAALQAALATLKAQQWHDISTAPKDSTPILVRLKDTLPDRQENWVGRAFVASHPGLADDDFDIGWSFAAPVGMGGFPDEWIAGWLPIPATD